MSQREKAAIRIVDKIVADMATRPGFSEAWGALDGSDRRELETAWRYLVEPEVVVRSADLWE